MKRLWIFSAAALLAVTMSAMANGTVVTRTFYSELLGYYKSMNVYLPDGYDSTSAYPVIYFLHGHGGNHTSYPVTITVLDSLIANGTIPPVVFVRANGWCAPFQGSMWTNSELYGPYEDYVIQEVIPFVENNFAVYTDRWHRTLMGHSMGGLGTLNIGPRHSGMFGTLVSLSGTVALEPVSMNQWTQRLLWETGHPGSPPYVFRPTNGDYSMAQFAVAGAFTPNLNNPPYNVDFPLDSMGQWIEPVLDHYRTHMPPYTFRQNAESLNGMQILIDCGTQDEFFTYPNNLALCDTLDSLGISHTFTSFNGDHVSQFGARFRLALLYLYGVQFAQPGAESSMPAAFVLHPAYPNPFNATATIRYEVPVTSHVSVMLYDVLGREMTTLVSRTQPAGTYSLPLDASAYPSGIYFCRLQAGVHSATQKLLLIK